MRYGTSEETWSVEVFVLGGRTDHAIRVRLADDPDDDKGTWIPWSQIETIEGEDGPLEPDELEHGVTAELEIPLWLAEREGWA